MTTVVLHTGPVSSFQIPANGKHYSPNQTAGMNVKSFEEPKSFSLEWNFTGTGTHTPEIGFVISFAITKFITVMLQISF